jgi:hypothetical protein
MKSGDGQAESRARPWKIVALFVLGVLAMASAFALYVMADGLKQNVTIRGPFSAEASSKLVSVPLPANHPFACCARVLSDAPGNEKASRLRLWVGETEILPAHALHETIRRGGEGFSHWGDQVMFALPSGVANTDATEVRLEYPLTGGRRLLLVPAIFIALAIGFALLTMGRIDTSALRKIAAAIIRTSRTPVAVVKSGASAIRTSLVGKTGTKKVRSARSSWLWYALGAGVLAALAVASALLIFAIDGDLKNSVTLRGPFPQDSTAGSQLLSVVVPEERPLRCCTMIEDDSMGGGTISRLRLWIDDQEIAQPHALHETIRKGGPGFSHWGRHVFFSLPQGVANSDATQIRLEYPLSASPALAFLPAVSAVLAGVLALVALMHFEPSKRRKPLVSAGNVAFAIFSVLTLAVVVVQLGAVRQTETVRGPFVAEQAPGSHLLTFALEKSVVLNCCLRAQSDIESGASVLRLWINGKRITAPHAVHQDLREGAPGFSHWGNTVYLTLPAGVPNSDQTVAKVEYSLALTSWLSLGIPLIAGLLAYGLHRRRILEWIRGSSRSLQVVVATPHYVLHAFGWSVLAAAAVYAAVVLWGAATGDALPLAIPFRPDAAKDIVEWLDSTIPLSLLILALIGAAIGWSAIGSRTAKRVLRRKDIATLRWMRTYGLAAIIVFFLASVGATWAGIIRSGTTIAFAGLVPFFDAGGYFWDVHTYLQDGVWTEFSSRRPLAAALRTGTFVLGDLRYAWVIVGQTIAVAGSVYFATMSVMRWRGVWSGIVFIALAYIAVRTHLSTPMTEALGLPIVFAGIGFLVEALRQRSKWHGLLALTLLSLAIWVRPGPMFVMPALAVWFGWSFGKSVADKAKLFALACAIIVGIVAIDAVLGKLFGSGSPGNLAFSLCGLTVGGSWSACLEAFPAEFAKANTTPENVVAWLYAQTIQNLMHDPGPLLHIVFNEPIRFLTDAPRVLLRGYTNIGVPGEFPGLVWLWSIVVLFVLTLRQRSAKAEAPFWVLMLAGLMSSATLFYLSDGTRAFTVMYPVIALFVALVFTSPSAVQVNSARTSLLELKRSRWILAVATALVFVLPPLGRILHPPSRVYLEPTTSNERIAIVGNITQGSGVLIVSDETPLPHGVPSMHYSRFAEVARRSGAEATQGIVTPVSPAVPFGFVILPRLDSRGGRFSDGGITLITPPEMITRRDVDAWRVSYEGWNQLGGLFSEHWYHVVHADPFVLGAKRNRDP